MTVTITVPDGSTVIVNGAPVTPPGGGGGGGNGGGGGGGGEPPPSGNGIINVALGEDIQAALDSAKLGEIVQLANGEFKQSVLVPTGVTLRGMWRGGASKSGTWIDCADVAQLKWGKGAVVVMQGGVVEDLEVIGGGWRETVHSGTAGIRAAEYADGPCTVKRCYCHHNQNGLFGGYTVKTEWTITDCKLEQNGILSDPGYTHNAYIHSPMVTITNLKSINPNNGHALKVRGNTKISDSTFDGGVTGGQPIDFPDGGRQELHNVTITNAAGNPAHTMLGYAEENTNQGTAGLTYNGGAVHAMCDNPKIRANGPVTFVNTQFSGNPIAVDGPGPVTGLPGGKSKR